MTISIESVATDQDLADAVGGFPVLFNLLPREWNESGLTIRQKKLDEVLRYLLRRSPPIYEGYLSDVTELKDAVIWGSLAELHLMAVTGGPDDPHRFQSKEYTAKYKAELDSMAPTLSTGERMETGMITISRR